ncbi:MAG TPA: Trp biosynthesis-associated membrane protein [Nocardioides sp.]|nr:Trp biosynthesis-associated membrane protein [Nocardioides sp.]
MADPSPQDERRRTFGPVVLAGLAAAVVAAVAGTKPWVTGESGGIESSDGGAMSSVLALDSVAESPLAAALSLVLLACWGVLLVTRGRVRRAVAVLALVTAVGLTAAAVEAFFNLPDALAASLLEVSGVDTVSTSLTAWYPVALVSALASVAATVAAVRVVGSWPEMGTRYDAPAGAQTADDAADDVPPKENIDIWKALDEGRDPTA